MIAPQPSMGTSMSSTDFQQRIPFFLSFCSTPAEPILSSRPAPLMAAARRVGQGWPSPSRLTRVGISRPLLDRPEHGGRLGRVGINPPEETCTTNITRHEAEPASSGRSLPRPSMRWDRTADPYHDADIRIDSEAPKQRCPFLYSA
jgi:hypothetical protein